MSGFTKLHSSIATSSIMAFLAPIIDSRAVDDVEHLLIVPVDRDAALPVPFRWARTGIGV